MTGSGPASADEGTGGRNRWRDSAWHGWTDLVAPMAPW
jgi:hypothetical protein